MPQVRIRAVLMRGGTSKGLFFHRSDLPEDPVARDRVILAAFGGGDPYGRQIDGVGGATSNTSKVVIIGPPSVPDADVDYTFGQVSITTPLVDYGGTCGNLTAAVGPFAIEEGLVRASSSETVVRIWQTNTRKWIIAIVPTTGGLPEVEGNYTIDGVPGSGAMIVLEFLEPSGAVTGLLLPTGCPAESFHVPGIGNVTVSLVDVINPVAFIRASDLGLRGVETPEEIDSDRSLLMRLEAIRAHAAVRLGIVSAPEEATVKSPGIPKIALVAPPVPYNTTRGVPVNPSEVNLVARIMSMGRTHRAYALSGAGCTAAAALIEGTVVHEVVNHKAMSGRTVRIGHPSGVLDIGAEVARRAGGVVVEKIIARRTARRLMEGAVLVPASVWRGAER